MKKIKLTDLFPNNGQIKGVPSNPRTISTEDMEELKKSLKEFTKMLALRPIIIDENRNILGGNMRYQALVKLAEEGVTIENIDKDGVLNGYTKFANTIPEEWVLQINDLTIEEKKEFIIKDNQERGVWDYDKLESEWKEKVESVRITKTEKKEKKDNEEKDEEEEAFALPPELDGVDIEPEPLSKMQGDDKTTYEYIVLTYQPDKKDELLTLLGVKELEKVVYSFEDIIRLQQQ